MPDDEIQEATVAYLSRTGKGSAGLQCDIMNACAYLNIEAELAYGLALNSRSG